MLSTVYEGLNINDKEPVAIKFERVSEENFLKAEAFFLLTLKGFGIPKILSFGKNNTYNILVEELLGLSIFNLWKQKKLDMDVKIKNVCMIALQALDRLEYIHSKNIIHRDIKPSNFLIGRKNREIIYLIDFGFANLYRNSRTGKHIKYGSINCLYGSIFYNSINANKGYEQSRKDDLESLGHMLIYLALNYLPWGNVFNNNSINEEAKLRLLLQIKSSTTPEKLCNGLPKEFTSFIKYCRNLEFEQEPNYYYLKSLFTNILSKIPQKAALFFFWKVNKPLKCNELKSAEVSRHIKKILKKSLIKALISL